MAATRAEQVVVKAEPDGGPTHSSAADRVSPAEPALEVPRSAATRVQAANELSWQARGEVTIVAEGSRGAR